MGNLRRSKQLLKPLFQQSILPCLLFLPGCISLFSDASQNPTVDPSTAPSSASGQASAPASHTEQAAGQNEATPAAQEGKTESTMAPFPGAATQPDAHVSLREVASLQVKVAALERRMANLRKEMQIIRRGLQTGLLDALPDSQHASETEAESAALDQARIDLGFEDTPEQLKPANQAADGMPDNHTNAKTHQASLAQMPPDQAPYNLLEKSSALIEKRDYAAALVHLTALKENYPQFKDEGLSELLLAEAWLALEAPDKALPPLERFLGVYSSSPFLPRAKLAQANALYRLGERQRSITLLLEVISLAPKSPAADIARSRLSEIKEVR